MTMAKHNNPKNVATLIAILKSNPSDMSRPIYMARDPEMNSIHPIFEVCEVDFGDRKELVLIPDESIDLQNV